MARRRRGVFSRLRGMDISGLVERQEKSIKGEDLGPERWKTESIKGRAAWAYIMQAVWPFVVAATRDPRLDEDGRMFVARYFMKEWPRTFRASMIKLGATAIDKYLEKVKPVPVAPA